MKIAVGINAFKPYDKLLKRELFCVESLKKLKNKFSFIDLYIITFEDDKIEYEGFKTVNKLKKKSNKVIKEYFSKKEFEVFYNNRKDDIDNNKRELPIVNEIFDVMSDLDSDYFLFTNSDILFQIGL